MNRWTGKEIFDGALLWGRLPANLSETEYCGVVSVTCVPMSPMSMDLGVLRCGKWIRF